MYGDHRALHLLTHSFPTRLSSDLRVVDRTPAPPRHRAVMGRAARPLRERHVLGLHPRARGEDDVPEAGLPFIDPQQIVLHRKAEVGRPQPGRRSEEHTSELQSLMRISYAVFCLKKNKKQTP